MKLVLQLFLSAVAGFFFCFVCADMSISKVPLVLLSGLLCTELVWRELAYLLEDDAEVTIFSFAACKSIGEMAKKVLDGSPDTFALAGHSMGGRVALEVFRQAPDRVSRLALLNTGVHPLRTSEKGGRQHLLDLAENSGMHAVADAWLPPMLGNKVDRGGQLVGALREMIVSHTRQQFQGQIQALLNRPDAESILPKIDVPTLLLTGKEDLWSPVTRHEEIQRKIGSSKLVTLDGVGHMSTVEAPDKVAEIFRMWLRGKIK